MFRKEKLFLLKFFLIFTALLYCVPSKASSPPNLDEWLASHLEVANTISFEFLLPPAPPPPPPPPPPSNGFFSFLKGFFGGSSRTLRSQKTVTQVRSSSSIFPTLTLKDSSEDNSTLCQKLGYCQVLREQTENVPPNIPQDPAIAKVYNWTEMASTPDGQALQQKIRNDYAEMWNWLEIAWPKYQEYLTTGVKSADFDSIFSIAEPVGYPPLNLQWMDNPPVKNANWEVIPNNSAIDIYSHMVALSIALEIKGVLGTRFADLNNDDLKVIFDGTRWFHAVGAGPSPWGDIVQTGYLVVPVVLPAPPQVIFSFLAQNKMIGGTRQEEVVKWLDWQRGHLNHMFWGKTHPDCTTKPVGFYSNGYLGNMPFTRLLNGTKMACPIYYDDGQGGEFPVFFPDVMNWTGGCGMTSLVNELGLRVLNIVARATSYGHKQNSFKVDNNPPRWMAHADHSHALKDFPEIPTGDILIDDAAKKLLFVDYDPADPNLTQAQKDEYAAKNKKGIGRPLADLMIQYLPKKFLKRYCNDLLYPAPSLDQSWLYLDYFASTYSVSDLQSYNLKGQIVNLWTYLDTVIQGLAGGCNGL